MNTLENFTMEVTNVNELLKVFRLFYYLGNSKYSNEPVGLLTIFGDLEKGKYRIARFNDWLVFKLQDQYCRLNLERLNKYIESLNIKER